MAQSIFGFLHLLLLLLLSLVTSGVSKFTVKNLPGFSGTLPFELETGYETVEASTGVKFFYYFVKSENDPVNDPLFFWFVGGPGCAAINALVHEIGPLEYDTALYDGKIPTIISNQYSFTKISNMVFVDHPVGSGFSYSTTNQGSVSSDTTNAKQAHAFIEKWLADHPDFLSNDIYLGGDSYGGTTVPLILQEITNGNQIRLTAFLSLYMASNNEFLISYGFAGIDAGNSLVINLKGYVLGNPVTDRYVEENSQVPYSHGMALISDELYESARKNCREEYVKVDPSNVACQKDMQAIKQLTKDIYEYDILERNCSFLNPPTANDRRGARRSFLEVILGDGMSPDLWHQCKRNYGNTLSYYWANDKRVQAALGVKKGTVAEWVSCNQKGIHYQMNVNSSVGYHATLSKRGLRSLIYNGDHDLCVPFLGTQAWIRSLNYSISEEWRPWSVEGLIAGYTRTYTNNMTFATVKGGGHTAPEYKPKECLTMLKRWFSHEPL